VVRGGSRLRHGPRNLRVVRLHTRHRLVRPRRTAGGRSRGRRHRPARRGARDRLPADALHPVLHPGDRGDAARSAVREPGLGPRDPGPPPLAGHHGRAAAALLGLGALGGRGVREPCQLSRVALVPLARLDPELVWSGWWP
jgi:hypothetical protein